MLGADVVMAELQGLSKRQLGTFLVRGVKGMLPPTVSPGGGRRFGRPRADCRAETPSDPSALAATLAFGEQTEQDVLGAD